LSEQRQVENTQDSDLIVIRDPGAVAKFAAPSSAPAGASVTASCRTGRRTPAGIGLRAS
jgi:hypothetical protein